MHAQWHRYFRHYADVLFPAFALQIPWNYKNDICMLGSSMLFQASGEEVYRASILRCGERLTGPDGPIARWDDSVHNLDFVSFGKSLLVLYRLTGNAAYRNQARMIRDTLSRHPRTASGNYWHKDIYPHQVWLDGLYMALPFQAQCDLDAGTSDFSDILSQFRQARALLFDAHKRLYRHAYDQSRQMEWADPLTGQSPCFWLRAEGWQLMALCDVYETLHPVCPEAEALCELLTEAVEGLLPWRDAASGMFLQLIDRADLPGNYPETSGSAMVSYALMKAARLGMLPNALGDTGSDIFECIRTAYLSDGEAPVLRGICASAGLGPGPDHRTDRDGTARYYLSERQKDDNQHGGAACMMAGAELLLREAARSRAGK